MCPPEEDFEKLPASTVPEMQRTNLAPVILQLKALGIDNVLRFSFLSVSGSLCIHRMAVMMFSPTERGIVLSIYISKMACTETIRFMHQILKKYTSALTYFCFEVHSIELEIHFNFFLI